MAAGGGNRGREVKIGFLGDVSSLKRAIDSADRSLRDFDRQVDTTTKSISGSFSGMGTAFAGIGTLAVAGVGMAAAKIGEFAKSSFDMASASNEAASKVRTVFGDAAGGVQAFADSAATSLGMSTLDALNATGTFGNMFVQLGIGQGKAADLSMSLTTLAGDFASFHNASRPDVIEAMTAAFRGEYDALQRYVPTIQQATVDQLAMQMTGKRNADQLTAQEKALAVYKMMLDNAGPALDDFTRTQDSAANQMAITTAQFQNAQAAFGQALMPIATQLMTALQPVLVMLPVLLAPIVDIFKALTPILVPVIGAFSRIATVILENLKPVIETLMPPLSLMVMAIGQGLVTALQAILPPLGKMMEAMAPLLPLLADMAGKVLGLAGAFIGELLTALVPVVQKFVEEFVPVLRDQILPRLPEMMDATLEVAKALGEVAIALVPLIPSLADMMAKMTPDVVNAFKDAMLALAESLRIIEPILKPVVEWMTKITDLVSSNDWLKDTILNMLPGVGPMISNAPSNNLPGRAMGGPVRAGHPYLVGENGPEVFMPGRAGTIVPNGAGNTYNIYANQLDGAQAAAFVAAHERAALISAGAA